MLLGAFLYSGVSELLFCGSFVLALFLVILCFSFPENSRFVPSDKKQEIFYNIINGDLYFSGNGILPK